MREIRTSGLMSGERRRADHYGLNRAFPRLYPLTQLNLFSQRPSRTLAEGHESLRQNLN
jgi:hypothetical protein